LEGGDEVDSTLEALQKQVEEEEVKQEKAQKRYYKYREAFTGGSYFTQIPKLKAVEGLRGPALTSVNLDKTVILKEVIAKVGNPKDILGELQYCFITFLLGENLEAFEQWKSLVSILCSCPSGI
jgi:hypothetical protein